MQPHHVLFLTLFHCMECLYCGTIFTEYICMIVLSIFDLSAREEEYEE